MAQGTVGGMLKTGFWIADIQYESLGIFNVVLNSQGNLDNIFILSQHQTTSGVLSLFGHTNGVDIVDKLGVPL